MGDGSSIQSCSLIDLKANNFSRLEAINGHAELRGGLFECFRDVIDEVMS